MSLSRHVKRIHFVRHGQGHHNAWREAELAAGRTPHAKRDNMHEVPANLHDAELTEAGRAEAEATSAAAGACRPELLVTSPLRRAMQTGLAVFREAVSAGVPVLAHELCREQFRSLDPSIYDSRKPREDLQKQFPQVSFDEYVLPSESETGDPLWWHSGSPFGSCEGGMHEAAMVENAWQFLGWLMARPEREIAVATHSLFLLAMYHGALEPRDGGRHPGPQVFHTGELRSLLIEERPPGPVAGAHLVRWASTLAAGEEPVAERKRARAA